MQEFFDKFKDAAAAALSENTWRFTKEEISKKAEEAKLPEELRAQMAEFLDFAAEKPDLFFHMWQWYYTLYESGEDIFPITRVQKLPRHGEAEEKFPGVMESVIYLAAVDHFADFLKEKGLLDSEFDLLETYRLNLRRFANFNYVRDNTYALLRLGYFLYGYSRPFALWIGRLSYEIVPFKDFCEVYEGEEGRVVVARPTRGYGEDGLSLEEGGKMPVYAQYGASLTAHVFDSEGRISREPVTLDLRRYKRIYKPGDMVVTVHIPGEGKLTADVLDASLSAAKQIFRTHFSDMQLRGFVCHSWLLDPQLRGILGETSNILAFQRRFDVIASGADNNALYEHIFRVPICPVEELKAENRFQAGILDLLRSGKKIRAGYGFLKEETR